MRRLHATRPVPVYLLVCGSLELSDGAAAVTATGLALADLRAAGRSGIRVIRCKAPQLAHLLEVPGDSALVIADAAVGVAPGTIVRRTLDELIDDPHGPRPSSAVAAPIDQLLGMANVLSDTPRHGLFVGIGGAVFRPRRGLSADVRDGLPEYARALAAAISELAIEERALATAG